MKKIFIGLGIFILAGLGIVFYFNTIINSKQIDKKTAIYIKPTDSLTQVIQLLKEKCSDIESIKKVIALKKYTTVKAGKYILTQSMTANEIVNLLRSGNQTPVKVTFNNQNYIENLAGRLAQQVAADSLSILKSLTDTTFLKQHGLTQKTALNYCMPYTYDCYWTISPNQLRDKLYQAYKRFWTPRRLEKANNLGLSSKEVVSLASIVHSESQHRPERKRIAGVYVNRLKIGMPLQADPTINYAWKEKYGRHIVIKRTLDKYKNLDSPYNTYRKKGVPPYPIAMPDVDAINAVLDYERHKYIYFCADTKKIGTHKFAKTYRQHLNNSNAYHKWLDKQKIRH